MSQSEPCNCDEVLEHLFTYLDGELTSDIETAVRRHLAECQDCSDCFEFESTFLRFVEARSRAQAAPAHLRKKIFEQALKSASRDQ